MQQLLDLWPLIVGAATVISSIAGARAVSRVKDAEHDRRIAALERKHTRMSRALVRIARQGEKLDAIAGRLERIEDRLDRWTEIKT